LGSGDVAAGAAARYVFPDRPRSAVATGGRAIARRGDARPGENRAGHDFSLRQLKRGRTAGARRSGTPASRAVPRVLALPALLGAARDYRAVAADRLRQRGWTTPQ